MDFIKNFFHQSLGVIIEGGFTLVIAIVLTVVAKQIIRNIYNQTKKIKGDLLRKDFISCLVKPLRFMIWLIAVSYLIYIFVVRIQLESPFQQSFKQFRNLVIIVCATWFCFELKKQLFYTWSKGDRPADKARMSLTSKLVSLTILILSGLIILDSLGVNIGAILAFGGVGGLAMGFAAKDVFANFFSGFMLHVTKPFEVGNWIHNLDESLLGYVEHIGFYLTRLRGVDKRPIYVPNSLFSSQMTVNATRMTNRRILKKIGIRYEDFGLIEAIIQDIRVYLKENSGIDQGQSQLVNFVEFADSSLTITVDAYTITVDKAEWLLVQEEVLIGVGKIIEKHGAEMAFPTSTLHINYKSSKGN